jgi:hypothetical protein
MNFQVPCRAENHRSKHDSAAQNQFLNKSVSHPSAQMQQNPTITIKKSCHREAVGATVAFQILQSGDIRFEFRLATSGKPRNFVRGGRKGVNKFS